MKSTRTPLLAVIKLVLLPSQVFCNDACFCFRYYMISGLKGSGVKDLTQFLMEQACVFPLVAPS